MIFHPLPLAGAYIIDIVPHKDERGFFARTVCHEVFEKHALNANFVQQSISWNKHSGTLRGLHYQAGQYAEDKLVRVVRGAVMDIIVDICPESPTYRQWYKVELSEENHRQIYVPKGFAHGFQTLRPETEVLYEMTEPFHPNAACGIRWNDPALGIQWPACDVRFISYRDQAYPDIK